MNLWYGVKDEAYKAVMGHETAAADKVRFESKHIDLVTARNQEAAFQILLKADEEFLLSTAASTCFDKKGHRETVRLSVVFDAEAGKSIGSGMNLIGFVEDDDRLLKADILLNQENISVEKDHLQPVWVEFAIPCSLSAGEYSGQVEFYSHKGFEAEKKIGAVSFRLDVKNVTLPDPAEYSFYLDLWQHNSNIARKHEVQLWSDAHFEVMEKYVASLGALGQKAVSVIASEIPWSGQFCYRDTHYPSNLFEYSMVRVEKTVDGKLSADFSVVDRYIELCAKYGINQEIEVFGLINIWMCEEEGFGKVIEDFSDGIRVRYLDKADSSYKYINTVEDITAYIQLVEAHFKDTGMIGKVRIVADEPADIKVYLERLDFLKRVAPSFQYKAAINHVEFIRENSGAIRDFVPLLNAVCSEYDQIREMKGKIEGRLYWYVCCCPPIPNTFIRSNLLESFAIGWLTEYLGLDGFLRWNYTVWPENPREKLSFRYPAWPAGDTNFVYPANNGQPLLSLRYKALLRGIQGYELMAMLKKSDAKAKERIDAAFGKIFRFKEVSGIRLEQDSPIDSLISLDYKDYQDAAALILSGLEG